MYKLLFGLVAGVLCLAMTNVAEAAPGGHHRGGASHRGNGRQHQGQVHRPVGTHRHYYHNHGVRFHRGYYFAGRHHNHWGHRIWSARYNHYIYWEPVLQMYYFYDDVQGGYYPCD